MAKRVPNKGDRSAEALSLLGFLILGGLWLVFTHDLYLKQFGLIMGLVIAYPKAAKAAPQPGTSRPRR